MALFQYLASREQGEKLKSASEREGESAKDRARRERRERKELEKDLEESWPNDVLFNKERCSEKNSFAEKWPSAARTRGLTAAPLPGWR